MCLNDLKGKGVVKMGRHKKPVTMKTKRGWKAFIFYNGEVIIKNEKNEIISMHNEAHTQDMVILKYKKDGWFFW